MQLAGLLGLVAVARAAYEADQTYRDSVLADNDGALAANPGPTEDEILRVQRFLSFPPEAQEKALAYLQNLQRYLSEGE